MRENRQLEYKETVTNTFLKTVSAFANYDGGTIVFGISDDGKISPMELPETQKLNIENKINDSIVPRPDYRLTLTDQRKTITLTVFPGQQKPYLYKAKAYKRNDTATIEVDQSELKRLILEGKNIGFEELRAENQDLHFSVLEKAMQKKPGIKQMNQDILKSLGLFSAQEGYNNSAEILSDENAFPGISAVKFGDSISVIQNKTTSEHKSVIQEIEDITDMFKTFYVYEEIDGTVRHEKELIPMDAFREALANAAVHRDWSIPAEITVFMYKDRIEISSPGGLVPNLSKEEYLRGGISIPRNRILAEVFLRIGMIEKLGTGILRIKELYRMSRSQPVFDIMENSIRVTLPLINSSLLSVEEEKVYSALSKSDYRSISEITVQVPYGRSKVLKILNELVKRNMVFKEGTGRGTKYHI